MKKPASSLLLCGLPAGLLGTSGCCKYLAVQPTELPKLNNSPMLLVDLRSVEIQQDDVSAQIMWGGLGLMLGLITMMCSNP